MTPVAGAAGALVRSAGGVVDFDLPLVNGVVADVPTQAVDGLRGVLGVVVSPDAPVAVADVSSASSGLSPRSPASVFPQSTGATALAAEGTTGTGVNVAVLDTGIDALPDFGNRLIDGIDLSGEGHPFQDSYGHGTFVAGVIAGSGASSGGTYMGEAPGAGLVSVKVAGASGSTDLATVIEGITWVVNNRIADHIGVLNISMGSLPWGSTALNPLDRAVEAAWGSGVTVVVSAGNSGPFNGTITSPGDDPLVVTAGASDDQGTVAASDDTMTAFSSVGPTNPDGWIKPDLVAPGRSLVSLRAPGSTIDNNFPSARIGVSNFVGSGTSFSAAITSGAAALVLQSAPGSSPTSVKAKLVRSTAPGPTGNPFVDGHGSLDVYHAAHAGAVTVKQPSPIVPTPMGATVSLGARWVLSTWNNGSEWNGSEWNGSAWNGSEWNGSAWNGSAWNGSAWNGAVWG